MSSMRIPYKVQAKYSQINFNYCLCSMPVINCEGDIVFIRKTIFVPTQSVPHKDKDKHNTIHGCRMANKL